MNCGAGQTLYTCKGCAVCCDALIGKECDFTPIGCLAGFNFVDPIWEKVEEIKLKESEGKK